MKGGKVFLEMMRKYKVEYIFGLPGETSLPIYVEWFGYSEDIKHILVRDERSSAFMADGYARVSYKPGVLDAPSPGATHILPGIVESYKSSVPIIAFTTDIPLHVEKMNMLTGYDQSAIFKGITKETYTVTSITEIPFAIRRAFRLATTGKPGPVHVRLPYNILKSDGVVEDIYAQKDFIKYPGHRYIADTVKLKEALNDIANSENPVIVCGQGVLYSHAWEEVIKFAEFFGIPVGTTITGKGCISDSHPLSIGVVGSRGGTSFSNEVVKNADTIFFIGCNTDSAATDSWKIPSLYDGKRVIHLDISEAEVGNVYKTEVILIGDAKASLEIMNRMAEEKYPKTKFTEIPRIKKLLKKAEYFREKLYEKIDSIKSEMHPFKIIKFLEENMSDNYIIVSDPGISAIYTSTFWNVEKPGRTFLFNYSIGALGYALPASIGAFLAKPDSLVLCLTGDGSFGFTAGEFETVKRINPNIKIILFNNGSFGWIRASIFLEYGPKYFSTDFIDIEYSKIVENYKIQSYKATSFNEFKYFFNQMMKNEGPSFLEVIVEPEDIQIPPVPKWTEKARKIGRANFY